MTVDDPTPQPPAAPVDAPPAATTLGATGGGWGRGRLLTLAGGAVGAVAVAIGIVVLVMGRSAGLDLAAGYVPADAVIYMELQLDLPGEQREQMRTLLERFPAIDADDLLGPALADTLDEALASSGAPLSYSDDIAPWFTGRAAIALNTFPAVPFPAAPTDVTMEVPQMVVLFGTRDAAAAEAAVDTIRGSLEDGGATFTSSEVDGITLWEATSPGFGGTADVTLQVAVTDDQVVVGINGGASTALDVHAGRKESLAKKADLAQLVDRLPKERAATVVVNSATLLDAAYPQSPLPSALAAAMANTPDLAVESVSFEADAVRIVAVSGPLPDGAPTPTLETDLAAEIPGDALLFFEGPGFGDSMETLVDTLKASFGANRDTALILDQIDEFESGAGFELEDYFDWTGGVAIAAGARGADAWGGVIFEVTDQVLATERLAQLDTIVSLAAQDPTSGVVVTRRTVSGTEATRVLIVVEPTAGLPITEVVLEYAMTDDRLLLGFGDEFVGRALELAPADSLAQADGYERALAAVGGDSSRGVGFVDIAATRSWVETLLPADGANEYYRQIAPNLAPLDYLAMGSRMDGRITITTILLKLN